uniref:Uncharacterized protein n=1 Tax=viral metagenome TaxID=1070528 RepID=A0A6M3L1A0_9ZZZZ
MTLTKDDVTAMRQSTGFVIHGNGDLAEVRCLKRIPGTHAGPFASREAELEHEIPDVPCRISMSNGTAYHQQKGTKATTSRTYADYGAWPLLARAARAGDALEIHFSENGNQYVHGVDHGKTPQDSIGEGFQFFDLHHDECQATLKRTDKRGVTRAVVDRLVLDTSICPNNSARMIQH